MATRITVEQMKEQKNDRMDDGDDCKCISEYNRGIKDAIYEFKRFIKTRLIDNLSLEGATKYDDKDAVQAANSYSAVMKYEIADCIDDLLDDLEQLKEHNNER